MALPPGPTRQAGLTDLALFETAKTLAGGSPEQQLKPAIVDCTGTYTYKQLLDDARKVRWLLGDRIHPERELAYFLNNSDAKTVIVHPDFRARVASALSGSWGRGVQILDSGKIAAAAKINADEALTTSLWAGATVEMHRKFYASKVWDRVMQESPAKLIQEWERMDDPRRRVATEAFSRLRLTASGSAALPNSVFKAWQRVAGQVMLERYGMSEIGMALSNDAFDPSKRRPGSVGVPLPGVSVRLADGDDPTESSGEIQVKGDNVFKIYYGLPDKTKAEFTPDGWFKTGDIALRKSDGLYYIQGRSSVDIIKSGGYKISALEIERELLEHSSIQDAAVVGVPNHEWGEIVAAAVTLREGVLEDLTIDCLKVWCKPRISTYKVPRLLAVVKELPRNLMGKLDKKQVKQLFL
ncbi:hypothetical protein EV182_002357 [Spiromyces aspiralis]|uniref:Uncharacterized protein n=1 Tax=Spiromyces aspiralis TaxID=68401 RepID=A0ACC1HLV1_9FUNG|nr:hypothetical protein EV182_002357 [Spiromyces aspiralis]